LAKIEPPSGAQHPDDLLLPYLEGMLSHDQSAAVEQHLAACADCSAQVLLLRELLENLRLHREAFCPEPWQIFELVHYGRDPAGSVAAHVEECEICAPLAQAFAAAPARESMPPKLWAQVSDRLAAAAHDAPTETRQPWWNLERFREWFRAPAWAIGAATVAVLLVVILYPREIPQQMIAMSSVSWENVAKPKAFHPEAQRAAIILALRDFPASLSKTRVDALYTAVAPSMEVYERYRVVPPASVSEAVRKGAIDPSDRNTMLSGLREGMGVALAVFVTVRSRAEVTSIEAELVDTKNGDVIKKIAEPSVADKDLESGIRKAVLNLLLQ